MLKVLLLFLFIHSQAAFSYEVDDFYCSREFMFTGKQKNVEQDVNQLTRSMLKKAVDKTNATLVKKKTSSCCVSDCIRTDKNYRLLFDNVMNTIAEVSFLNPISPLENEIRDRFPNRVCRPSENESICYQVDASGSSDVWRTLLNLIDSSASALDYGNERMGHSVYMCGQTVGTDKLGHFFGIGRRLLSNNHDAVVNVNTLIKKGSMRFEGDIMGSASTGVYSFADVAADIQGSNFYRKMVLSDRFVKCEVKDGQARFVMKYKDFNWCDHVNLAWNESINCSAYSKDQLSQVKINKTKYQYTCPMTSEDCNKAKNQLKEQFIGIRESGFKRLLNCENPITDTSRLDFLKKKR